MYLYIYIYINILIYIYIFEKRTVNYIHICNDIKYIYIYTNVCTAYRGCKPMIFLHWASQRMVAAVGPKCVPGKMILNMVDCQQENMNTC